MGIEISKRIIQIRKENKLTQTEFGKRLNVNRSKISNYELNTLNFDNAFLDYICKVFGINYDWLITGQGDMHKQDAPSIITQLSKEFTLDEIDKRIITSYLGLDAAQRRVIKEYIGKVMEGEKEKGD